MSEFRIKHGRPVQRETLDRGDILLHPPEDWRRRWSTMARKDVPGLSLVFGLFFLMMFAFAYLPYWLAVGEQPTGSLLQLMILVPLGSTALIIAVTLAVYWAGLSRYPAPGVYEKGVQVPFAISILQVPIAIFIPWDEFGSLRHIIRGIKKDPFIAIDLRYKRERAPWWRREFRYLHHSISSEFLGEEGIHVIEERTGLEVTC